MNTNNLTHNPGWQKLGELELPVGIRTDDILRTWLLATLDPLALSNDFWNRVLSSVIESAARALRSGAAMNFAHIHFSVFAPNKSDTGGKTWGFFHIERIESQVEDISASDHAIDLYLYMEGE